MTENQNNIKKSGTRNKSITNLDKKIITNSSTSENQVTHKNTNNKKDTSVSKNSKNNGESLLKNVLLKRNSILAAKKAKKKPNEIDFHFSFKKGKFLSDPKILSNFLSLFNIRELFILMELDDHIHKAIIDSEVFQKYLLIRNEIQTVINSNKTKLLTRCDGIKFNTPENIPKNNIKKISDSARKFYEKYSYSESVNPITIGVNSVLAVYTTRASEKAKLAKDLLNEKKKENEEEEKDEHKKQNTLTLNLPKVYFNNIDIEYFISNNEKVIKKFCKTYSLNSQQSKTIFNGIIEYILLKSYWSMDNNKKKSINLQNTKSLNGLCYYVESILNLDYSNIVKIDLSSVGITNINLMKKLCYILYKYANTLRVLNLSNNLIDDKCAKLLFAGLQTSRVLEILNISDNSIGSESLKLAEIFFSKISSLSVLVFNHNLLGPLGSDCLFQYFSSNKNLEIKTLNLEYNGITKDGTNYFDFFKYNKNLITLQLGGNYLRDEGIKKIAENFIYKISKDNDGKIIINNDNQNRISYLDIHDNNITKNGMDIISNTIIYSPFINGLYLSGNNIENEGVHKLFSNLNSDSKLISLDLADCKLGDKALRIISEKLSNEFILEKLILSNNNFKHSSLYIKNLLIKETNLKNLQINYLSIIDNNGEIFNGLSQNFRLKNFGFSGNSIQMKKEILEEIRDEIRKNTTLQYLYLDDCNVDDIGINYIIKGLENNHILKVLSLNNNYITKKHINNLISSIEKSGIINKINLNDNKNLSAVEINKLQNVLNKNIKNFYPNPNNKIIKIKDPKNDKNDNEYED